MTDHPLWDYTPTLFPGGDLIDAWWDFACDVGAAIRRTFHRHPHCPACRKATQ